MITGLRPATYEHLAMDAGIFLMGIDPKDYDTLSEFETAVLEAMEADGTPNLLGATRGGGTFTVVKESRDVEADGSRYRFVGSTRIDKQEPHIATTLIEVTPGNLQRMLVTADITPPETGKDRTSILPRNGILRNDYIPVLTWVGDKSDGGYVVIVLYNAINISDATIAITDKGEATLAVDFYGAQDDVTKRTPPYAVYVYDKVTSAP